MAPMAGQSADLKAQFHASIPAVDFSLPEAESAKVLRHAAVTLGFFYITNHGISKELLAEMFAKSGTFFALPMESKLKIAANKWNRGYTSLEEEYLAPGQQTQPDTKESVYIRLVRLLALSLGLPADHLSAHFTEPLASLRLLHYPAAKSCPEEGIFGAGAHRDYGTTTILATDNVPGLQVEFEGEWIDIAPRPGHLIVNLGDLQHRWTNGVYKSALHRVVNHTGKERLSTAFFVEPNFDSVIEPMPQCCSSDNPPRWPPVSSGDYIMAKYSSTMLNWEKHRKHFDNSSKPPVSPEGTVAA